MSRLGWVALVLLGGGLGLLGYLTFGGLSDEVSARAKATATKSDAIIKLTDKAHEEGQKLVEEHPDLKTLKFGEQALALIEAQRTQIQGIKERRERIRLLLAEDRSFDAIELDFNIWQLEEDVENVKRSWLGDKQKGLTASTKVLATTSPAEKAVGVLQTLAQWFKDFDGTLKRAQSSFVPGLTDNEINAYGAQRDAFVAKFPESKTLRVRFDQRLDRMKAFTTRLTTLDGQIDDASSQKNISKTITLTGERTAVQKSLSAAKADWDKTCEILPKDIDKVLVDMQEGASRTFQHKLKVIHDGKVVSTKWVPVSYAEYESDKEHLGMTIYSKPAGVMPEDADVIAAPPGYRYVGNSRYGRWRERNGMSYWEFYGRYALMRDLFWGVGRYRPIYRSEYRSYRRSYSSRRPYYGARKQFGTSSAMKSKRYKDSKYASKRRQQTKYSGSKYSGSRRSGGYRNSRYRSSSFGGGGK